MDNIMSCLLLMIMTYQKGIQSLRKKKVWFAVKLKLLQSEAVSNPPKELETIINMGTPPNAIIFDVSESFDCTLYC